MSMMLEDESIAEAVLLTQLPTDSWFQGTCLRPDGRILASRLDLPELYLFDPAQPEAEPVLLHSFSSEGGLMDVCPMGPDRDEYLVVSGVFDIPSATFEQPKIWKATFSGADDQPNVELLAEIDQSGPKFVASIWPVSERTLAISDTNNNCIWRYDLATGRSEVLARDISMHPAPMKAGDREEPYGINRIRVSGNYVYYGNESKGLLGRVPVEFGPDGDGWDLRSVGPAQIISEDTPHSNGLVLTNDGKTAYSANYVNGTLKRVDIDEETGKGKTTIVMENIVTPASLELLYPKDGGKPRMYILCAGEMDLTWVKADGTGSWADIANINVSVTVTVTTEEVVESAN